ncbi:BnaA09g13240D [Brassica napus]|uniref:BnaA09g13240D protein n=1 Tax=Brassica napus TaxID=3708 RepID=A0A078FEY3_BRANA|nr:BnaA09g13240D [Brassica napus]
MYSLILRGRRRLQKCRLSLNVTSFSSAARKGQNFTVSYLVDSLGFTPKLAESISKKVSFNNKCNPDSVLNLLRTHGFTDSQISTIITDYPLLLTLDADKSLAPKLQALQSKVSSPSELTETISKVPKILSKDRSLSVYYGFVKEVMEADKSSKVETLYPLRGKQENKLRNVLALRDLGVPQRLLFPLLISECPHICGKEKFQESLKKVLEMGFDPTTHKFLEALRVVKGLNKEAMEEKVNVYKRLGFTVEDVWVMFKKFPQCIGVSEKNILNSVETFIGLGFSREDVAMMVKRLPPCIGYSVETVKKKIEFVVKEMGWTLKAVASYPQVLGYSMEKRMVPRCNVIKALIAKGLIRSELPPVSTVLVCTDQDFLKRYVRKHDDDELVAELMGIFTGE